jgi:hypothetical protein
MRIPPKWDDTIDAHLRRLVGEYGPKWKLISKSLGEFTDLECKHRWMFLSNHERLRQRAIILSKIKRKMIWF